MPFIPPAFQSALSGIEANHPGNAVAFANAWADAFFIGFGNPIPPSTTGQAAKSAAFGIFSGAYEKFNPAANQIDMSSYIYVDYPENQANQSDDYSEYYTSFIFTITDLDTVFDPHDFICPDSYNDIDEYDRIQFSIRAGGSLELSDNNIIIDNERRFINNLNPLEPSVMSVYDPLINKRKASSVVELTRSPQDVINDFTLNQLGNFDFNDKYVVIDGKRKIDG